MEKVVDILRTLEGTSSVYGCNKGQNPIFKAMKTNTECADDDTKALLT